MRIMAVRTVIAADVLLFGKVNNKIMKNTNK